MGYKNAIMAKDIVRYGEKAVEYFCTGYNCAQSTAAAFAECADLGPQTVFTAMAGFGGGIGGLRETCGAISGMVWALGTIEGAYDPLDTEAKTAFYESIRGAIEEFKGKFGTICCRELLLKAECIPQPDPSVRNAEYYAKRPCAHFIQAAAEIAARKIDAGR